MALPVDIYVRVSRRAGREDERFHSPEEQEQLARAYAASRGLDVGIVLTPDIDRSGGTVEREGLQQALRRIRAGESQGFVVAWLDRFSRDAAQAYDLLRQIEAAGGRVYAPEAPEDVSSPEGELQLGMFLLIAQYQRKRSRAGFQRAKERAIRAGIPVGPTPLGYRQRANRVIEVDPSMAPVVREVYERKARGEGSYALSDFLREHTGHSWTPQGVRALIRRRIYATGRLQYGDVVSDHDAGALVDEPLWHAAQSAAARPRKPRDPQSRWLLTGLLKCAACRHNLTPVRSSAKVGPYRRYNCRNRACRERAGVSARLIEPWVIAMTFRAGDEMEAQSGAPDLGALEEAAATAERRLAQVLAPDARDALGELWAADVRARREERDLAAAVLFEARSRPGGAAGDFRLREVWDDLSPHDRREALQLFWREIRVGRKGPSGRPITLVARGPHGEAEVELSNDKGAREGP